MSSLVRTLRGSLTMVQTFAVENDLAPMHQPAPQLRQRKNSESKDEVHGRTCRYIYIYSMTRSAQPL